MLAQNLGYFVDSACLVLKEDRELLDCHIGSGLLFQISIIYDVLALTLAALDAVWLHKTNVGTNREHTLQAVGQALLHIQHSADVVAEEVATYLHLYL
jgi:hypothetical protein